MSVEAFIAYDPPDGGQPLRGSPDDAWRRTARFLEHCTTARPERPHSVKLTIYEPSGTDPAEWYRPTLAAAKDRFGPAERRAWATGVDELYCTEWDLDAARVAAARTFLAEGEPWPRTAVGPAEVLVGYAFRWIDLENGEPLPGQDPSRRAHPNQAESTLLLGLGRQRQQAGSGQGGNDHIYADASFTVDLLLFGSNTARVIRAAACPVLIVHETELAIRVRDLDRQPAGDVVAEGRDGRVVVGAAPLAEDDCPRQYRQHGEDRQNRP
mgnify:CR=1 FL=1